MKHLFDDSDKNKYEGYTKQEVLEVIQEAISSGELPEEINGLVLTFKNPIDNQGYKIAFCTQSKYNELKAAGTLEANCIYFITDDTTFEEFENELDQIDKDINDVNSGLKVRVSANETNIGLLQKILKNAKNFTNDEYEVEVTNDGETLKIKGKQILINDDIENNVTLLLNYDEFSVTFETWNEGTKTNDVGFKVEPDGSITLYDNTNSAELTPAQINELKNRHLYRHDIRFYLGSSHMAVCSLYLNVDSELTNVTLANYISSGIDVFATGFYKSTPNADPKVVISLSRDNSNWKVTTIDNVDFNIDSTTTISGAFYDTVTQIY